MIDWAPFIVSLKLSAVVTLLLFCITFPLAWFLAHTRSSLKPFIEAVSALPIVLPPTVLGFYLLVLFSQESPLGIYLQQTLGLNLLFSFEGLVVASLIYSFPFMLQPLQSGLESLPKNLVEASYTLGKGRLATLRHVVLPNIRVAIITGAVITFAHTMGEFGVVLMVGGNIDGVTKVASIAIYDHVEALEYTQAHIYSAILVAMSFIILLTVYIFNRRFRLKAVK